MPGLRIERLADMLKLFIINSFECTKCDYDKDQGAEAMAMLHEPRMQLGEPQGQLLELFFGDHTIHTNHMICQSSGRVSPRVELAQTPCASISCGTTRAWQLRIFCKICLFLISMLSQILRNLEVVLINQYSVHVDLNTSNLDRGLLVQPKCYIELIHVNVFKYTNMCTYTLYDLKNKPRLVQIQFLSIFINSENSDAVIVVSFGISLLGSILLRHARISFWACMFNLYRASRRGFAFVTSRFFIVLMVLSVDLFITLVNGDKGVNQISP